MGFFAKDIKGKQARAIREVLRWTRAGGLYSFFQQIHDDAGTSLLTRLTTKDVDTTYHRWVLRIHPDKSFHKDAGQAKWILDGYRHCAKVRITMNKYITTALTGCVQHYMASLKVTIEHKLVTRLASTM